MLVKILLVVAKEKNVERVTIDITAAHSMLKTGYSGLGFIVSVINTFNQLPFAVIYLYLEIE